MTVLPDRAPYPVGAAAGGAAGDFELAVDGHRMRIAAALRALAVVGRTRNDIAIAPRRRVPPRHRRPRRAAFQRLDLRLIGKPPVVVVERAADFAADQPGEFGIGQGVGGGGAVTRPVSAGAIGGWALTGAAF